MQKKTVFYCIAIFVLFVSTFNAEGQIMPHSNIQSTFSGINGSTDDRISVDPYTGTLNVGFPIFHYDNSARALENNVSINYDARGVKVDELASDLGLNWNLNIGGSISRTIKGLPDEDPRGYANLPTVPTPLQLALNVSYLTDNIEDSVDGQYDVYHFTAGQESGDFLFGKNGAVITMPKSNLRIEKLGPISDPYNIPDWDGSYGFRITPKHSIETYGMPTASLTRILDGNTVTPDWKSAILYYDDHGRLLQMQSTNAKGGKDTVSCKYNFKGNLLSTLVSINNTGAQVFGGKTRVAKNFIYDASWRLTDIYQKLNDQPYYKRIDSRNYDDLSKVSIETLGMTEDRFYKYTIWGSLQSINKSYYDGTSTDNYFGEVINYEIGFNASNHLGIPSSLQWRQKGSESTQRAYSYTYDPAKRLVGAAYSQKKGLAATFTNTEEDYTANNMQYDANGNLLSMDQWGTSAAQPAPFKMDQLTYRYKGDGMTDQLDAVDDQLTTDYHLGEFNEAAGTTATDYSYDANGNATQDKNKNITSIAYNYLNKPFQIDFTNNRTIKFKYDASGELLNKQILEQGTLKKNIDYINGLEFENDSLKTIQHEDGRVRPIVLVTNGNQYTTGYEYDFFIKDHQGNVRSVVTELPSENWFQEDPSPNAYGFGLVANNPQQPGVLGFTTGLRNYLVTNEPAQATIEEAFFDNVAATRDVKPNSTNPADVNATRLNANDATRKVGPSILLRVMAGDKVQVGAEAYYDYANSDFSGNLPLDQQIAQAITALSGAGAGNLAMNEGTMGNLIHRSISGDWASVMPALNAGVSLNLNAPQAFLNCLVLDDNLQIIPGSSQILQVYGGNQWVNLQSSEFTLKNSGYLSVYVNNTSPMDVNFDNISVKHTKGKLLQESHYYPYGLAITSQPYANVTPNNFWYLGSKLHKQEFSDGSGLNWAELGARQYDPQIGRWHSPDLLQEYAGNWSPYRYGFDNPVVYTDPSGLDEDDDYYYRDEDMQSWSEPDPETFSLDHADWVSNGISPNSDGSLSVDLAYTDGRNDGSYGDISNLVDNLDSHYDFGNGDENSNIGNETNRDQRPSNVGGNPLDDGPIYASADPQDQKKGTYTSSDAFGAVIISTPIMKNGAAMTLPPFIFVTPDDPDMKSTLRHEGGHIIQGSLLALISGPLTMPNYLLTIGAPSLLNAWISPNNADHQRFFTEMSANQFSYWLHGSPSDWDYYHYPLYSK